MADYICHRTRNPLIIDGSLAGPAWERALGSPREVANSLPRSRPAWCWSKHGALDTHLPAKFTRLQFSEKYVEDM